MWSEGVFVELRVVESGVEWVIEACDHAGDVACGWVVGISYKTLTFNCVFGEILWLADSAFCYSWNVGMIEV